MANQNITREALAIRGEVLDLNFSNPKRTKVEVMQIGENEDTLKNIHDNSKILEILQTKDSFKSLNKDKENYKFVLDYKDKIAIVDMSNRLIATINTATRDIDFTFQALRYKSHKQAVRDLYLGLCDKPDANDLNFNAEGFKKFNHSPHMLYLSGMKKDLMDDIKEQIVSGKHAKFNGIDVEKMESRVNKTQRLEEGSMVTVSSSPDLDEDNLDTELSTKDFFQKSFADREKISDEQQVSIKKIKKDKHPELQRIADEENLWLKERKFGYDFVNKDNNKTVVRCDFNPITKYACVSSKSFSIENTNLQAKICKASFADNQNVYFSYKNMSDEQIIEYANNSLESFTNAGFDINQLIYPNKPEFVQRIIEDFIAKQSAAKVTNNAENEADYVKLDKSTEPVPTNESKPTEPAPEAKEPTPAVPVTEAKLPVTDGPGPAKERPTAAKSVKPKVDSPASETPAKASRKPRVKPPAEIDGLDISAAQNGLEEAKKTVVRQSVLSDAQKLKANEAVKSKI